MALGYIDDSVFSNIANSIRTKTGTVNNYYPSEMADAINNISGGSYNSGILNVSANGEYQASASGLDGFNVVNVQVPIPTYNSGPLSVTQNGNYNAVTSGYDGFSDVEVNVPIPTYNSATLDITSNGVYNAVQMGYDGFNEVNVQVPQTGSGNINVFLDGVYLTQNDVTGLIGDKPDNVEARVYCNNIASINGTSYDNSVLEKDVTWEAVTNGFYNAQYNTYIYNNYLPMQRDSSLYAKFQGNSEFNLAIKTSRAVTNMSQMLNSCSNFNNSIQISDSVTNISGMCNACYNFNSPVIIGNNVQDMGAAFRNCNNFNQPIIVPNTATNCRTMLQGTKYNHPLTIPDQVTNCKWMLFNACDFNQPLVIGNNVVDCMQMLEAYWWDDSTETDRFEGGTFNQPIIFPKSVATANTALAGQQNMKSDIILHNNACYYNWFLGNAHYEGNIYCPNGIWASRINYMFAEKNNTSGIASIYTPQSYADYNSAIRSYKPTGNSDTWIGDETNELVYSPTANIYIHCNWNSVNPSTANGIQFQTIYEQEPMFCTTANVTSGYFDGSSFVTTGQPQTAINTYTGGSREYQDSYINVVFGSLITYGGTGYVGKAVSNITDGTNNYSSGDVVFEWDMGALAQTINLWER